MILFRSLATWPQFFSKTLPAGPDPRKAESPHKGNDSRVWSELTFTRHTPASGTFCEESSCFFGCLKIRSQQGESATQKPGKCRFNRDWGLVCPITAIRISQSSRISCNRITPLIAAVGLRGLNVAETRLSKRFGQGRTLLGCDRNRRQGLRESSSRRSRR